MQDTVVQSSVLANRVSKIFLKPQKSLTAMALVCSLSMKSIKYSSKASLKGSGCGKSKTINQTKRKVQYQQKEGAPSLEIKQAYNLEPRCQNVCVEHNMKFEDFCRQDQQLVCRLCKTTSHKGHQMEDHQKVLDDYEGKARSLAGQLKEKSLEVESGLQHIQTCIGCVTSKKDQFKRFIKLTINSMVKNLIATGNHYQRQIDQWESDILNEHENLQQAWKYATREYYTADPFEVVQIEENLRKLDSLESDKANKENLKQLEGYDPKEFVESMVEFKCKAEEELQKLKGLILQSNLFYTGGRSREFQSLMTIKRDSNQKITYNTSQGKFSNANVNIQPIDGNQTQIEQYQENSLIISGGWDKNQKDLILLEQEQPTQYKMKNNHARHRTKFTPKDQIFIISGYDYPARSFVKECEVFGMKEKKFQSINPITTPVYGFGCDLYNESIFCFGGRSQNYKEIDKIQIYNTQGNSWKIAQEVVPAKTWLISAIYVKKLQAFLIYNNDTPQMDTHIYDLQRISRHGEKLPVKDYYLLNTQPVLSQNFVYQFDWYSNLFRYDITKGKWNTIQ